ncbi:MAG: TraB/GumN family protein [Methanomassiliicoccales archaeon]|jgi:pheromone shutdown protein TraB|nr:TraB/GumN family protein [Methanomassiliicoccales archaeon]
MITLIGVGHVFNISEQVRQIIFSHRPKAVCVELDPRRYEALRNPGAIRSLPIMYRMLAEVQRRMAREFGGEVGMEMIAAAEAAIEVGAVVEFIDDDATAVFERLWKEMPVKEKVCLMFSAITGFFISKGRIEKELAMFEENGEDYLRSFGEQFPTIKRLLIDDRNRMMASRIEDAYSNYGEVVAVVGDGHIEGIMKLLNKDGIKVFRLRDLREWPLHDERKSLSGNAEASFCFTYSDQYL